MLMEIQGQETVSDCKNPLPVAEHSVTHTAETQYFCKFRQLRTQISRGECAMKSSVAPTEQAETVTFLSFCDLCSIIKRNYNQEGKNAFFER